MPPRGKRKTKKDTDTNSDPDNTPTPIPAKRRGRKPHGGKVVNISKNNSDKVPSPTTKLQTTIILHLKCKLSDVVNNDNRILSNPNKLTYNPDDIISHDTVPFNINSSDSTNMISDSYKPINFSDDENMIIESNDDNSSDDNKSNSTTINKNSNKEKAMLKTIDRKLKELEHNLNYEVNYKKSDCFWCTERFDTSPIHIPTFHFRDKYDVYGCFCSPECACAYLFNENINSTTKFERYQLLIYLYGKIYDHKKQILPAPDPRYLLDKYYGNMTIQEYRKLLTYERLILILDKPLSKVTPEIHEDNFNFESKYNNRILLSSDNNKSNNNLQNVINKTFRVS